LHRGRMPVMQMSASKVLGIAGLAVTRPVEFVDRFTGRREPIDRPDPITPTFDDAIDAGHAMLAVTGCTECHKEVDVVGREVAVRLGADARWERSHFDGGPMLARLLWTLVRHGRPKIMVETGVARGVSSGYVLEAMARNEHGLLVSVDLPPIGPGWPELVGSAVKPSTKDRWQYHRGAAVRVLPGLLGELGEIDIFVHDGLHTLRSMLQEYRLAWPHLRQGGLLVSDDIAYTRAWEQFSPQGVESWTVAEPQKDGLLGVARKGWPS